MDRGHDHRPRPHVRGSERSGRSPRHSNAFGNGDEVYSILQGSPALDAADTFTQTDYEYENEYYWLNHEVTRSSYRLLLYAFNECYDWNGDGEVNCVLHNIDDPVFSVRPVSRMKVDPETSDAMNTSTFHI